ncbi:hypothetical protein C1646_777138 [Rhizophagus diaphanus]|nr:hypothetical protein C1646_777138 [Rhizophagus diaphanus] [Rhizophagus sp. MUCL 43196]
MQIITLGLKMQPSTTPPTTTSTTTPTITQTTNTNEYKCSECQKIFKNKAGLTCHNTIIRKYNTLREVTSSANGSYKIIQE